MKPQKAANISQNSVATCFGCGAVMNDKLSVPATE